MGWGMAKVPVRVQALARAREPEKALAKAQALVLVQGKAQANQCLDQDRVQETVLATAQAQGMAQATRRPARHHLHQAGAAGRAGPAHRGLPLPVARAAAPG